MVALKQVLELFPPLHQLLQGSTSHLCKVASTMLSKQVNTSTLLLEMMHLVLIENAAVTKGSGAIKFSRALAVKPDVNGLLDIARTTFCEYVEFLEVYVAELGEEHQLPLRASLPRLPVMVKNLLVTSNLSPPPPPQPSKALLPSYSSSAGFSRSFSSESSSTIFGAGTPAEPVVFLLHLILSAFPLFFLHPQSSLHCSRPTLAPWRADSTRGELFRFRRHSTLPTPHHLLHTHSSLHRTRMEKEHASMIMLGILLLHHIQTLCMWNSSRSASFSWPDLPILAHLVCINIAIISSSCTSSIPHQLSVTKSHIESSRRHCGMPPVRLGWWWRGGVYIFSSSKKITIVASATCKIQMKGCDLNSFFAKN
jgi:hypothetical protein